MIRVDFFGPMGAGKSLLVRELSALMRRSKSHPHVRTAKQEKIAILLEQARVRSVASALLLRMLISSGTLRKNLIYENITEAAWTALISRDAELRDFLRLTLGRDYSSEVVGAHMARRMFYFVRDIADYALLEEYASADVVLHDESLLQRGMGFVFGGSREGSEAFLRRYCELVPAPDLAVSVSGDQSELVKRLARRDKRNDHHLPFLQQAERCSAVIGEVMHLRGVPLLCLDGLDVPAENVARIQRYLKEKT